MKTVAIIGSTGSIGKTTLKVLKKHKKIFKIILLSANKNYKKLNKQCKIHKPTYVYINNNSYLNKLHTTSKILNSIDDLLKKKKKIDYVISGASGFSAFDINLKLLKITRNLLIANKETIICGGNYFFNQAKKFNCKIIPIDSEHFCINYFLNFYKKKQIKYYYLTASGGPFLKKKPVNNTSIKKVINHPNWNMGKKISVSSANLTNKILELFEAYFLFKIQKSEIKIKIEKSSKIHSILSLYNGLDFLISHNTSMTIPIENSLLDENVFISSKKNIFLKPKVNFEIHDPDPKVFPIIKTGYKVFKLGHRAMIIFTILNDRLTDMFLARKKKFNDIVKILIKIFSQYKIVSYSKKGIRTLLDINKTIYFANHIKL